MTVVLVDLDNTLLDRVDAFRRWAGSFLDSNDLGLSFLKQLEDLDHDGIRPRDEFFELANELLGFGNADRIEADYLSRYPASFILENEVAEALVCVRQAGNQIFIVTNGPPFQEDVIRQSGLAELVDGWIVSEIVGFRKPDVRMLDSLPLDRSFKGVVIGDGVVDIELAHNLQVSSIWLDRGRAWNAEAGFSPSAVTSSVSLALDSLSHATDTIGFMSSKTHTKLTLTEDEMLERIRVAQQEDQNGTLVHIKDEKELRSFFSSLRNPDA